MAKKKVKVKSQIRVMKPDLQDLIRDEIYGAGSDHQPDFAEYVLIPKKRVAKLAKRIARRAIIGH